MSNKIKKQEKRRRVRRESEKKRKMRSIGLLVIGFIFLAFDAALGRQALTNYRNNNAMHIDRLGEAASLAPCILMAFIIILTIMILLKQNRKK